MDRSLARIKVDGQFMSVISEDKDFYYVDEVSKIPLFKNDVKIHEHGYGVYNSKPNLLDKIKQIIKKNE
jgi:hypothetical protein